jgi:hypothetical protein
MKQALFLIFALSLLAPATFAAEYTGKVLTPDGKPVKNATVYLYKLMSDRNPTTRRDAPTTQTDDTGAFHIPNPDSKVGQLVATADGFGFGTSPVTRDNSADIRLTARTDVTLTFLNADNSPAAHLLIYVRGVYRQQSSAAEFHGFSNPEGYRSLWSATTDDHGQCTIPGLPQGGIAAFAIDDERFAQPTYRDNLTLALAPKTQADPIHLALATSISGTATYAETGKPAAGFAINAQSNDGGQGEAVTAADGT